jgi:hypothetical protein
MKLLSQKKQSNATLKLILIQLTIKDRRQKTFNSPQAAFNRFTLFQRSVIQPEVKITHEEVGKIDSLRILQNVAIIKMEH